MEIEKWFKPKKYPHIGHPITILDYSWVKQYISNPEKIRVHSFLPLIHKTIKQRKFRADKTNATRTPSKKRFRKKDEKNREIYFASHLDAQIFSYYNHILVDCYEEYIKTESFNKCIVAYRKIPISNVSNNNKCNIEFAKSTFEFIKNNQDKKLSVIVADVTSFFDNLNHKILKKQWCKILKTNSLPSNHYNVFKTLTDIKYIEAKQLFKYYDKTMIVERGVPNSTTDKNYKRKPIKKSSYFKEKKAVSFCTKKEFISNNLNLIISKNNKKGIPQGSPISATLANIYMLDFDKIIYERIELLKGYYQRYSDDLIIICEQKYEDDIIKLLRTTIADKNIADLEIQSKKTKVYRFEEINGNFKGFQIDETTKVPNYHVVLEYLGFTYDGSKVLIKTSGFSKFYRSMIKSFKKSASFAKNSKNPDKSLFKSKLYKRFTHKGAKRKLIYQPSKNNPNEYVKTKKFNWGNYFSYIEKSNSVMFAINNGNQIKKQSKKLWRNFHKLMETHQ
ncbi:reverse transcriptase domain-containing protein [uncultured Chryseobacterium sp.]|uniref:reverse transcriptase domain-containing protein n=1 Tax=uncultured Chryseobacterium sp. TaxID=259322 RepID=UPI0025D69666|nr:reverse transcriptase domain-containing protein [uncultured Chryseobacterium sp.]